MTIDLVKRQVFTEKATKALLNHQYTFHVDIKLNKIQIKKLIENIFKVSVVAVNTHRPPRKKKALGTSKGYRSGYKRVIVTLKPEDSIILEKSNDLIAPTK